MGRLEVRQTWMEEGTKRRKVMNMKGNMKGKSLRTWKTINLINEWRRDWGILCVRYAAISGTCDAGAHSSIHLEWISWGLETNESTEMLSRLPRPEQKIDSHIIRSKSICVVLGKRRWTPLELEGAGSESGISGETAAHRCLVGCHIIRTKKSRLTHIFAESFWWWGYAVGLL